MISDPKIQPPPQARFAARPRASPRGDAASGARAGPPNLGEACRLAGEPRPPRLRRDTLAGHCARRPAGRGRWPTAARTAQQCFPLMLCHNRVYPLRADIFWEKNKFREQKPHVHRETKMRRADSAVYPQCPAKPAHGSRGAVLQIMRHPFKGARMPKLVAR